MTRHPFLLPQKQASPQLPLNSGVRRLSMLTTKIIFPALISISLLCSGCGASIELQRSEVALEELLVSTKFYLNIDDGSKLKPDNWDGHINLLWTNDEKRAIVVAENIQFLRTELENSGFDFVENAEDCSVLANLKFKSVRFDPVGGWLTDDAQIEYKSSIDGNTLGTVVADERWVTPTVKMVFNALVKGSLELWGQTPSE
ncbi:MAG: hypothetical protein WBN32_14415 [Woeseia sp.]